MSVIWKRSSHKVTEDFSAKVLRPQFPDAFLRPRLFHRLDQARELPLTWICGPPGAGKTTLVSSYVERAGTPCLWYQLDERDADPATIFRYLRLAAEKSRLKRAGSLPQFLLEDVTYLKGFCRNFFEELFARLSAPFLLVLDNYQELPADSPVQKLLVLALESFPPGGNLFVLSRGAPTAAFASYRIRNPVALLEWNELRFTKTETRTFLRRRGKDIPEAAVPDLWQRTRGWAAGLRLCLEHASLCLGPDFDENERLPQSLFDFFADLPRKTQNLLLQTAFFPHLTAAMAEALTGEQRAGRILSRLCRQNYFVSRRSDRIPVYEYHPLLQDFLRLHAQTLWAEDKLQRIKRRTADILAEQGQEKAALKLYGEMDDPHAVARILLRKAPEFLVRGQIAVLVSWLQRIPERIRQEQPWLYFWLACCRLAFDPAEAGRRFDEAYRHFRAQDDTKGWMLACSGAVDALILESSSCSVMKPYIDEMAELLVAIDRYPSRAVEARVVYAMCCALFLCRSGHADLKFWAIRAETLCLPADDIDLRLKAACVLTCYRLWWGDFTGAGMIVDTLPDDGERASPWVQLRIITIQVCYQWLTGSPDEALDNVEKGLTLARKRGLSADLDHLLALGVAAAYSIGDLQYADTLMQRLNRRVHRARPIDVGLYRYLLWWGAMLRGNLSVAQRYVDSEDASEQHSGHQYSVAIMHIARAQLFCCQHRFEEARTPLTAACVLAEELDSQLLRFMVGVVEASLALGQEKEEDACTVLERTLAIGRTHGIYNFYGWLPEIMFRLCRQALAAGIEEDYVRTLIRKRRLTPADPPLEIERWPWPVRIYTLGRFSVLVDDRPVHFVGKTQKRPLELLQALIAFGGREIAVEQLADALWPDAEGEAGYQVVRINVRRLRQLLGDREAIELSGGHITLNPHRCWVDAWALERLLGGRTSSDRLEQALALYHGSFLAHHPDVSWALPLRMRLQRKLLQATLKLGSHYEQRGYWHNAVHCYHKGLDAEPGAEILYQRLMRCHLQQGHCAEALRVYIQCRQVLAFYFGARPSPETEALFQRAQT